MGLLKLFMVAMILFCTSVGIIYVCSRYKVRKYLPIKNRGNSEKQINWVILNMRNLELTYKMKDLNKLRLKLEYDLKHNEYIDDAIIKTVTNIIKPFILNNRKVKKELDNIKHLL